MSTAPKHAALSWDWKEQIDLDQLAAAIAHLTDGKVRLYKVDTGTDDVAVLLSTDTQIDPRDVYDVFSDDQDSSTLRDVPGWFSNTL